MGLSLSRSKYRAWSRLIIVFTICGLARGAAFGSVALQPQVENTNQEKQEPKPVATSEKKAAEQPVAADSESQAADSTSVEKQDPGANDSGDIKTTHSRMNSSKKAEFTPTASSWKPWGVTTQQTAAEPGRPPSFSLYFMSEYRRDEIKYTGKPSLTLQFPSQIG